VTFVRDEGSVYNAPLEEVWRFLSDREAHESVHHHREVEHKPLGENSGESVWVQDFEGKAERFRMRYTAFPMFGIAYEVQEGPLLGSKFFAYYRPRGPKTRVTVVGDFQSPTIPAARLEPVVLAFFALEFEQDNAAISARVAPK